MRVLLVDADKTGFPNLALMKISAWHKARGDHCYLNEAKKGGIDRAYISCVFSWHAPVARGKAIYLGALGIECCMGGSALNYEVLPDEIEHIRPDYSLYPTDYSLGFTSRGCIRRCDFCIVHAKEGLIRHMAEIYEFWEPSHDRIKLLDNNLLASPRHLDILCSLAKEDVAVDFNQGLDIRLVNDENAALLGQIKTWGTLRFAFDDAKIEGLFRKGMERLERNGVHLGNLMVYVLVGFNSSFEDDVRRLEIIKEYGACAYPMFYASTTAKRKMWRAFTGEFPERVERLRHLRTRMPTGTFHRFARFHIGPKTYATSRAELRVPEANGMRT